MAQLNGVTPEQLAADVVAKASAKVNEVTQEPANPIADLANKRIAADSAKVAENAKSAAPKVAKVKANTKGKTVDLTDPYRRMVAFTHAAIRHYRAADSTRKSQGIHTVYSGFYRVFMAQMNITKEQVWPLLDVMAEKGDIQKHPCKGGSMIYLPGEMPKRKEQDATKDLTAILASMK